MKTQDHARKLLTIDNRVRFNLVKEQEPKTKLTQE